MLKAFYAILIAFGLFVQSEPSEKKLLPNQQLKNRIETLEYQLKQCRFMYREKR